MTKKQPRPILRHNAMRWQRVGQGVLLYHVASDSTYTCGPHTGEALSLMDGRRTRRQITRCLVRRLGLGTEQAQRVLESLLRDLDCLDLLENP